VQTLRGTSACSYANERGALDTLAEKRYSCVVKLAAAAVFAALAVSPSASAVAPTLSSVTVQTRHPSATFSVPRADSASIYFSTKPDRATDGSFLTENIKSLDILTDSEIQSGQWRFENQLDPGTYWVMMRASPDFSSCWNFEAFGGYDPACANGYSNVLTLEVPKPTSRYRPRVTAYRNIRRAILELTATPLGETRPYRVCYRTLARRTVCVRGTLDGFSWNSPATDLVTINTRLLPTLTTFNWHVGTTKVATKRARVR
jgi:hypothetical protein